MLVGIWAAWASKAGTAKTMNWIAAGTGFWNDLIVGVIALVLGVWAARTSPRVPE